MAAGTGSGPSTSTKTHLAADTNWVTAVPALSAANVKRRSAWRLRRMIYLNVHNGEASTARIIQVRVNDGSNTFLVKSSSITASSDLTMTTDEMIDLAAGESVEVRSTTNPTNDTTVSIIAAFEDIAPTRS